MHWFGWILLVGALGLAVWLTFGLIQDSVDLIKRKKKQSTDNSAEINEKENTK